METKIEQYLVEVKKVESPVVREMLRNKVTKYDDIAGEFMKWLETQKYADDGLVVGDYTAKQIYEMAPELDGIGVFNFLVTLRERPEEARKIIESGFMEL